MGSTTHAVFAESGHRRQNMATSTESHDHKKNKMPRIDLVAHFLPVSVMMLLFVALLTRK